MLALNKKNLTYVQNIEQRSPGNDTGNGSPFAKSTPLPPVNEMTASKMDRSSTSTKVKNGASNLNNTTTAAAAAATASPPSSFCGSDCLYSTLDIQKFFNTANKTTTNVATPSPSPKKETGSTAHTHSEQPLLSDEKITDFCCDRSHGSNDDVVVVDNNTATHLLVVEKEEGQPERQKKFGFYTSSACSDQLILDDLNTTQKNERYLNEIERLGATASTAKKQVRWVESTPNIVDSLFEDSVGSEPSLSFASSFSDDSAEITTSSKTYCRLTSVQRLKIILDCRTYRSQIAKFEDSFLKSHGHMPKTTADKAGLSNVYLLYRNGKLAIRADSAIKIQSAIRGKLVRMQWGLVLSAARDISKAKAVVDKVSKDAAEGNVDAVVVAITTDSVPGTTPHAKADDLDNAIVQTVVGGTTIYNVSTPAVEESTVIFPNEEDITPENIKDIASNFIKKIESLKAELATSKYTPKIIEEVKITSTPVVVLDSKLAKPDEVLAPSPTTDVITEGSNPKEDVMPLPAKLTTTLLSKYLSPEEKNKIATKTLSSKLLTKEYKLPPRNATAVCDVCEMPKLATTKDDGLVDNCFICDELYKKISKRVKKENDKKNKEKEVTQKKIDMLHMHKLRAEMERQEREEWEFRNHYYKRNHGTDWSESVPSMLDLPVKVKARSWKMKVEHRDVAGGSSGSSDDASASSPKEEERVLSPSSSDDDSTSLVENGKKNFKGEVKEEFDELLDDADVEELQRKIHGCPTPPDNVTEKATEEEKYGSKNKSEKISTSYGGFSSKCEYDNFQQIYNDFERDHSDVVMYARDRVSRSSKREENARRIRSSSAPSVSSFDSRDRYRRHYDDYDSTDSVSELSAPHYYYEDERYHRRRHQHYHRDHSSRGRYGTSRRSIRPVREVFRGLHRSHARRGGRRTNEEHHRRQHHRRHYSNDDSYCEYSSRPGDKRFRGYEGSTFKSRGSMNFKELLNNGHIRGTGQMSFDIC